MSQLRHLISDRSSPTIPQQLDTALSFLKRMLRNPHAVVLSLLVGAIACAIFLELRVTPYRSETVLLSAEGIRAVDRTGEPPEASQATAVRLRETLLARPQLEAMISEFGLYPDVVARHGYVDAVEKFREKIEFRAPGGDTFSVAFTGNSPSQAQSVTQRLAEQLIQEDSTLRRQNAGTTRDFLGAEKKRTEIELQRTEKELAKFLADHPEFALDAMLLQPGASQTGAAFRAADAVDGAAPSSAPATGRYLPARHKVLAIGPVAPIGGDRGDGRLQVIQVQAAKARVEADLAAAHGVLAEQNARFTGHHPDVQAARANVRRAELRLKALAVAQAPAPQVARVVTVDAPPAPAPARRAYVPQLAERSKASGGTKRDPNRLISLETDWSRLTRDLAQARERHKQMETAFFKADISANSESGGHALRIAIIDPAFLPAKPVPPGKLTLIGIFLVLSLIVGIGLSAGFAAIDDRLYDGRDVLRLAPLLAEIPRAETSGRKRHA